MVVAWTPHIYFVGKHQVVKISSEHHGKSRLSKELCNVTLRNVAEIRLGSVGVAGGILNPEPSLSGRAGPGAAVLGAFL